MAVWIVLAVAISLVANTVGRETSNDLTLPGTNSTDATDLLDDRLPQQANGTNPVVLEAPQGQKLTKRQEPQGRRRHGQVAEAQPLRPQRDEPSAARARTR